MSKEYIARFDDYGAYVEAELIRCRDCKYYVEDPDPIDPGWPMMCDNSSADMLEPDGYCHRAERREP